LPSVFPDEDYMNASYIRTCVFVGGGYYF